jgi:hypothetical protein
MTLHRRPRLVLGLMGTMTLIVVAYFFYHEIIRPPCAEGQPVIASAQDAINYAKPRIYKSDAFRRLTGFDDPEEYANALSLAGCCEASKEWALSEEYWIVAATLKRNSHEYLYAMRVWRCGEISDVSATQID